MKKFLNFRVPKDVISSGTTTSGTADKLTDTGATFQTDGVSVGDVVVDADNDVYLVTAVDSETVLSVDGNGVPTTKAYTVYDGTESTFMDWYVALDNLMLVEQVDPGTADDPGTLVLTYSDATKDEITLHVSAFATNDKTLQIAVYDAIKEAYSSAWTKPIKNVNDFGDNPVGIITIA
jgi:hypothetical protein